MAILPELHQKFSVEHAYKEISDLLTENYKKEYYPIRHLEKLLTVNDNDPERIMAKLKHVIKKILIKVRFIR